MELDKEVRARAEGGKGCTTDSSRNRSETILDDWTKCLTWHFILFLKMQIFEWKFVLLLLLLFRHCQLLSSRHLEARKLMCPSEAETHNHDPINCSKGQALEDPGQDKACKIWDTYFTFTLTAIKAEASLDVCLHLLHKGV